MQAAIANPYRQPVALYQQNSDLFFGHSTTALKGSQNVSDYFAELKNKARAAGFQANTPTIDLTGNGSGLTYALEANTLAFPWLVAAPAFPGSEAMAIKRVPCSDIARAWLLLAPNDLKGYTLSPDILTHVGLNFPKDFALATELVTPSDMTIYIGIPKQRLQLWQPIKPIQDIIAVCEQQRTEQQR